MAQEFKLTDLSLEEKALIASPYGFGKYFLGLPIMDSQERRKIGECRDETTHFYDIVENDKQRRVVDAIEKPGSKVSVRTANGAGKTTIILPTTILWAMGLHPRTKVVITSGVERQVRGQIFPALKTRQTRLKGWEFNDTQITAPNGSVAVGFATNDGGRFEGWHGNKNPFYDLLEHDGPLLIVIDEAKSVPQTIHDAVDRCTYQWLLMASSCGGSSGEFYKSHTINSRFFQTFQITAGECPHADHKKNLELIQKRGINDPLVRSKVFAEFMAGAEGACVNRAHVEYALRTPPAFIPGVARIFCDFAAGGDENVIGTRNGNKIRIHATWREKDTMRAIGTFINYFRELGVTPENCFEHVGGDEGGMGKVILDRMRELGWELRRVNNGLPADDKAAYKNHAAETWFEGAKKIEQNKFVLENVDDRTVSQLTERLGFTPSDGRREIESKEDMRGRGIDSPDRADVILELMRDPVATTAKNFMHQSSPDMGLLEQMLEENGMAEIPGAYAG